ncbi:MAG: hypothetical protein R3C40_09905 [Parvularculaceae bacterium]
MIEPVANRKTGEPLFLQQALVAKSDFHACAGAGNLKKCLIDRRRPEFDRGIVGNAKWLLRDAETVFIEFPVGVLVMVNDDGELAGGWRVDAKLRHRRKRGVAHAKFAAGFFKEIFRFIPKQLGGHQPGALFDVRHGDADFVGRAGATDMFKRGIGGGGAAAAGHRQNAEKITQNC